MTARLSARLTTARGLVLRPFAPGDAPAVRDAFNAPGMYRQFGQGTRTEAIDEAVAGQWIEHRQQAWHLGTAFFWAVTEGAALLGNVAVGQVNHLHGTGWISYWTVPAFRRRGVATEAVSALTSWCFGELELFRLELAHRVDNAGSCRVATAAGFAVEGRQRAKLSWDGVRYDTESHARLTTD